MKMIDTETGHEMVEVSGHDKKEYASKGVAGTGLGLGIAGTALWLLSGGLEGMIDGDGLLNDMIDRLIVSKANTINGVTIGEGSIKVTIPFMNKTVVFDKDDFNELKTNIENYEKSK